MKTSVGQTLSISFGFCNENKKLFIPILFSMYLVYFLSVFLNNYFYNDIDYIFNTEYLTLGERSTLIENVPSFLPPQFSEIILVILKGDLFISLSSLFMGIIYISGVALLLFLVESMYKKRKLEYKNFLKSLPKIIFISIATVILIVLGIMIYIFPGILLIYILFYIVPESTCKDDNIFINFKNGLLLVFQHPDYTLGLLSVITATIFSLNYILIYLNDLGALGNRGILLDLFFILIRGVLYTWAVTSNMVAYLRLEN
ncbi:MAG: hypothetical protein GYA60_00560 [Candidatus Methanofastidiosa archaeon]|nr:hypothetical protein [Candidatus Methanofastidiosa archaeon]